MSDNGTIPEYVALPEASDSASSLQDRSLAFYNALLTEQFVLQSVRGVTVSESSSRASLYLMTLSSSLLAFGFLAQTPFAYGFLGVMIPVVVLLGIFTYERLVETSLEDVVALVAIQRIRRYYATLLPGAGAYFSVPTSGSAPNELLDIGRKASWRGVFFTMSSAIAVVNSLVAGAGIALIVTLLDVPENDAVAAGVAGFLVLALLHGAYQEHRYGQMTRRVASAQAVDWTAPNLGGRDNDPGN